MGESVILTVGESVILTVEESVIFTVGESVILYGAWGGRQGAGRAVEP